MSHDPSQTEIKQAASGKRTSGSHLSYWLDSTEPISYSPLTSPTKTDVVVVGGGIAGVTVAYRLLRAGKKVILIEDGNIGSGETGRTTAHIVSALDDRYSVLEKQFGAQAARLYAESHTKAIAFIEEIVRDEKIDCEFSHVSGYLFLHPTDSEEHLRDEFKATQRMLLDTVWHETTPSLAGAGPCIEFREQAQFHPLKYLRGLCDAIIRMGGEIYTSTRAQGFDRYGIDTAKGIRIDAEHVVVATNTPANDMYTMHSKQYAYRTYVVGVAIKKGSLPYSLWWDTGDRDSHWSVHPYHYIRLQEFNDTHDLLLVGGEDHKTARAAEENEPEAIRFDAIEEWLRAGFPMAEKTEYRWSGQVMESVDNAAFIGRNPGDKNIYIVTGDSGNGITHGTIAGGLITDLITGKENPYEHIYDPARKEFNVALSYIKEAAGTVAQLGSYLTEGDVPNFTDVAKLSGAIIRDGVRKLAVYRDEKEELHVFSAVCPHNKCILEWNNAEKSFDCPCHGSRFSSTGKLLNGPAIGDLEEMELPGLKKE